MCYYLDYTKTHVVLHTRKNTITHTQIHANTHTQFLSFIENKFFIYALFDWPQNIWIVECVESQKKVTHLYTHIYKYILSIKENLLSFHIIMILCIYCML